MGIIGSFLAITVPVAFSASSFSIIAAARRIFEHLFKTLLGTGSFPSRKWLQTVFLQQKSLVAHHVHFLSASGGRALLGFGALKLARTVRALAIIFIGRARRSDFLGVLRFLLLRLRRHLATNEQLFPVAIRLTREIASREVRYNETMLLYPTTGGYESLKGQRIDQKLTLFFFKGTSGCSRGSVISLRQLKAD